MNEDQIYKQLADEVDRFAKKMGQPIRGPGHPYSSAMTLAQDWARIEYENARKGLNAYVKGLKQMQDSDLLFENTKDSHTIVPLVLDVNDELKR